MADQYGVGVSGISLVAATAKTLIECQGSASSRGLLKAWAVSFNGVTSDVPVLVEVLRATATSTGTAIVPVPTDPAAPAMQGVVQYGGGNASAASVSIEQHYVTPNGGLFYVQYPLGDEKVFTSASFVRIRATAPSAETAAVTVLLAE